MSHQSDAKLHPSPCCSAQRLRGLESITGQEEVYRSSPVITQRENIYSHRICFDFIQREPKKRLSQNKSCRKLYPGVYIWKMYVKNMGV